MDLAPRAPLHKRRRDARPSGIARIDAARPPADGVVFLGEGGNPPPAPSDEAEAEEYCADGVCYIVPVERELPHSFARPAQSTSTEAAAPALSIVEGPEDAGSVPPSPSHEAEQRAGQTPPPPARKPNSHAHLEEL